MKRAYRMLRGDSVATLLPSALSRVDFTPLRREHNRKNADQHDQAEAKSDQDKNVAANNTKESESR